MGKWLQIKQEVPSEWIDKQPGAISYVIDKMINEIAKSVSDILCDGNEYIMRMEKPTIVGNGLNYYTTEYRSGIKYEPLTRCKDCVSYLGEGRECLWGLLTGDMGFCHPCGSCEYHDWEWDEHIGFRNICNGIGKCPYNVEETITSETQTRSCESCKWHFTDGDESYCQRDYHDMPCKYEECK